MVGPLSDEERRSGLFRLKLILVLVIGASAGLMTLHGDAPPALTAAAVVSGLAAGAVLTWYVFPAADGRSEGRRGR